jgi:hypothetical protein
LVRVALELGPVPPDQALADADAPIVPRIVGGQQTLLYEKKR